MEIERLFVVQKQHQVMSRCPVLKSSAIMVGDIVSPGSDVVVEIIGTDVW